MYRIWRRWLSLLTALALALVFCFAACPFAAFADDTGQKVYQDMIYYTITPMHEVTITGARAILTEANIPAELDGCPVTEIERYAFKDCTRLKQVTLPDTIRRIGEFAFKDCTRLERISIPDTVSDIGWGIVQGTPLAGQPDRGVRDRRKGISAGVYRSRRYGHYPGYGKHHRRLCL